MGLSFKKQQSPTTRPLTAISKNSSSRESSPNDSPSQNALEKPKVGIIERKPLSEVRDGVTASNNFSDSAMYPPSVMTAQEPFASDANSIRTPPPPRSPMSRPVMQSVLSSRPSRLTKPPVPLLSSRARRARTATDCGGDNPQSPTGEKDHTSPIHPYGTPMPLCEKMVPMYPYMMPMMIPVTTMYGQIHQQPGSTATVVYTSGPIPQNTTSIIFVPMGTPSPPPPPPTPPPEVGSNSSEVSESIRWNQPLIVFIERNVFKQWFETNMPPTMRQLPFRLKRYKSIETFLHWLTSRKKYESLELIILVRVTEIHRLLGEVKHLKNYRVFGYEHLFDVSQQPGNSLRFISDDLAKLDGGGGARVNVSHCLEEACVAISNPIS